MQPEICRARKCPYGGRVAALSVILMVAGCASLKAPPTPVTYDCEDGKSFSLSILPADAARIEFDGMRFPMRREPSASGMRYVCDVMTFTGQGEQAQLDIQDRPAYRNCRVRR